MLSFLDSITSISYKRIFEYFSSIFKLVGTESFCTEILGFVENSKEVAFDELEYHDQVSNSSIFWLTWPMMMSKDLW